MTTPVTGASGADCAAAAPATPRLNESSMAAVRLYLRHGVLKERWMKQLKSITNKIEGRGGPACQTAAQSAREYLRGSARRVPGGKGLGECSPCKATAVQRIFEPTPKCYLIDSIQGIIYMDYRPFLSKNDLPAHQIRSPLP